ncbi:hypothetical protein ACQ4PT_071367 [Festuca glaucescens]
MGMEDITVHGRCPAAFLTIGAIFLPETPSFLIQRDGNIDQAKMMLQRLRGTTGVQKELDDLVTASNVSRTIKNPYRNILKKKYRPQLVIALLIPFFNQVTGINVINFYAPVMFRTIGLKESASLMSAVVTRLCATVANIVAMIVVDRFGRRKLLLVGGVQMILSQFTVGAVLAVKFKDHGVMEKEYAYLVLVIMCVFVAGVRVVLGAADVPCPNGDLPAGDQVGWAERGDRSHLPGHVCDRADVPGHAVPPQVRHVLPLRRVGCA